VGARTHGSLCNGPTQDDSVTVAITVSDDTMPGGVVFDVIADAGAALNLKSVVGDRNVGVEGSPILK
jgi:hypothetical protein